MTTGKTSEGRKQLGFRIVFLCGWSSDPGTGAYVEYESGPGGFGDHIGFIQPVGGHGEEFRRYDVCDLRGFCANRDHTPYGQDQQI